MNIVVSERVQREHGTRIRAVDARASFVVPALQDGAVQWSGDPANADVCFFSEDFWQDLGHRQRVIPELFRLTGLKWFHTFSAGVDSPAFKAMIDRGTILTNSSGASATSIAQYVLAMMLHRAKGIDAWHEQQARREWRQHAGGELTAATAGIIGAGAIGGEVARLAKAFGMRTIGARRSGRPARHLDEMLTQRRLPHLLKQSDYVVIACPLTEETERMIGERELRAMKPTATLINIARGRIVDEAALVRALEGGWIAGACLDVFTVEPLPEDSPLWSMPNVMVTPHNSAISPHNMERVLAIFLDNLARFMTGKPLRNRVRI